jgi:biotin transport system substrate-specific component
VTTAAIAHRVFPRTRLASVTMVLGAAALTALAAQWRIDLPFTPVPITGQTFAVLLTGAALGMRLGAAGQGLYVLLGILGAPVFAGEWGGGWDMSRGLDAMTGSTAGYLFGFVIAGGLIGYLAERRQDRTFATMFTAFIAGSAVIYTFGVIGLMITVDMSLTDAVAAGVVPFVVGDIIKAAAAGLLLPGAWRLLGEHPTR